MMIINEDIGSYVKTPNGEGLLLCIMPKDISEHGFDTAVVLLVYHTIVDYGYFNINNVYLKRKTITIGCINRDVCNYFNLTESQLFLNTRKRETVQARQIAMFFSKNLTKCSLATIGSQIGGKDHATVLHACKTVNNLKSTDRIYNNQIDEIERKIKYGN